MINQPNPADGFSKHKIYETEIDPQTGAVTVSVGSYDPEIVKPAVIKHLRVLFDQWIPESYNSLEDIVNIHPEWVGTGSPPNQYCYWNFNSNQWVDMRDITLIKADKWREIKAARVIALTSPLITPFGSFDANLIGQKSITDAVLLLQTLSSLGTPSTIEFTLVDNTTITLTTEQMIQVGLLLGMRTQQIYAQGRARRDAINSATTASEVEGIVW